MKSAGIIILLSFALSGQAFGAPSFGEVKSAYRSSDAVLLDRHGEAIHELRMDPSARKLEWVKLADISPALVTAVLWSEDRRFYDHHGADWLALSKAAWGNILGGSRRGASTITMQLASLLDETLRSKKAKRTVGQKWEQIQSAQELEKAWTKDEILESYLNLVSFRGELQGAAAASRGLFNKSPAGLDEAESAVLAALIRSPNAAPEKVGDRAEQLSCSLGAHEKAGAVRQLAIETLSRPYRVRKRVELAPHAARLLLRGGAVSARSTLDGRIQRFAAETLRQSIMLLANQNVRDGAALVADNRTGDVLAYVGNAGSASSAAYVDGIRARRQAGSTLKPFLYGLAIEKRIITAASLLDDSPLDIATERGVYRPDNYDHDFRGPVRARTALGSSLNIPAVRTVGLTGVNAFVEELRRFGFDSLREGEYYGPSLALGTADITLWELVNAYRTLANSGVRSSMRLSPEEASAPRRRALSSQAAFIISDILSDREARSATFSLESPLATRFWAAAKTGTSKDMRDNWCVGYSDRYTVGVWVGNFSGEPMWNVSGVSGAAPVWLEIMEELHRGRPGRPPAAPGGIASQTIATGRGSRTEWFLAGTEPQQVVAADVRERPKIVYPAAGTVIAVDPDIPRELQAVLVKAVPADKDFRFVLDGALIGSAPLASWRPVPGSHHLSLVGRDGAVRDRITFEVR